MSIAVATIYCCGCQKDVAARLTNGREIYPHRRDLASLPFWKCDTCGNYVGCHHKSFDRTKPLGNISTPDIRELRKAIHAELDPLWKHGRFNRGELYSRIADELGWSQFHTAEIESAIIAEQVLSIVRKIKGEFATGGAR